MNLLLVEMCSPGGRKYKFSMEQNKIHNEYIESKNSSMMIAYLEKLKQQGLKPQSELKNNQQLVTKNLPRKPSTVSSESLLENGLHIKISSRKPFKPASSESTSSMASLSAQKSMVPSSLPPQLLPTKTFSRKKLIPKSSAQTSKPTSSIASIASSTSMAGTLEATNMASKSVPLSMPPKRLATKSLAPTPESSVNNEGLQKLSTLINQNNKRLHCPNENTNPNVMPTVKNKGLVENYEMVSNYEIVMVDDASEGQSEEVDQNEDQNQPYYVDDDETFIQDSNNMDEPQIANNTGFDQRSETEQTESCPLIIGYDVMDRSTKNAVKRKASKANDPSCNGKKKKAAKDLKVQDIIDDSYVVYIVERCILEEVLKNPIIFNFKLDFSKRSPDAVFEAFNKITEVVKEMHGFQLTPKQIENTWEQYRQGYVQYNNAQIGQSGAGADKLPRQPKHYDVLKQLDFVYDQFSTVSSQGFELKPPTGRKKNDVKKDEELGPLIKTAVDVFQNLSKEATQLQSVPIEIDEKGNRGFLLSLLANMNTLELEYLTEYKVKMLQSLAEAMKKQRTNQQ